MTTEMPHDRQAEQSVLGSLLIDRDAIAQVADRLKPEAFYESANATIYRAMLALWQVRRPCDVVTLGNLLTSRNLLDEVGGPSYFAHLITVTPTSAHVGYYADLINEQARRRALIEAGAELVKAGYASGDEPDYDTAVVEARKKVSAFDPGDRPESDHIEALIDGVRETAFRRWDGETEDRLSTGIAEVDRMTSGGMGRRELWVIAARPSMGKSALMLHMAKRSRSLIFSLEMPKEQLINRMIAAEAQVPYSVATSPIGDHAQRERWLAASERIAKLPIIVNDAPGTTTAKIQSIAARMIAEQGVNAVYIDHLNYLSDQLRVNNEQEKVGELVRRCKGLADTCDIPVVLLSQLNRESDSRPGCMPRMSDLRSSGRIEEDAYFVGLLYRRKYYVDRQVIDPDPDLDYMPQSPWEKTQVIVEKNRNGETGTAYIGWEPKTMTFHEQRSA